MKKLSAIILCLVLATASLVAQTNKIGKSANAKTVDLTIAAHNNEVFTVYLNGEQVSDKPGQKFEINGLKPRQMYDIEVYLDQPIKFIAGADLQLSAGHYDLVVLSDPTLEFAEVQFANSIKSFAFDDQMASITAPENGGVSGETEVSAILVMFSQEPFDDTRLHYAKQTMSGNKTFLVSQLSRISRAFAYDKARLFFLKFAYDHCADKENYGSLAETLDGDEAKSAFAEFDGRT